MSVAFEDKDREFDDDYLDESSENEALKDILDRQAGIMPVARPGRPQPRRKQDQRRFSRLSHIRKQSDDESDHWQELEDATKAVQAQ